MLSAASENACQFLFLNPSASSASFGLDSGVADFRHLSGASALKNPALLGKLNCISWNYSGNDFGTGDFTNSQVAFRFGNFGINVPAVTFDDFELGTVRRYEDFVPTNENGSVIGVFKPIESEESFQIATQINSFLSNKTGIKLKKKTNIYAGLSVNNIRSEISYEASHQASCFTFDFGLAMDYTDETSNVIVNTAFGLNIENIFGQNIDYRTGGKDDSLPMGIQVGASRTYSKSFESSKQNIYSIYYSADFNYYNADRTVFGTGFELSLLDILSGRIGYTNNFDSGCEACSYGFGVNLNSKKNKFGVTLDMVRLFDGSEIYFPQKYSFGLKYNF
jgi:hypothetical protein